MSDTDPDPDPTDPEVWKQHNDRPAWVQRHRTALQAATGKEIPQAIPAIADWLDDHKGAMTQKLTEQADESATDDESTNTNTDDGGDDA